jgi:hypothetical protein
MLQFRCSLLLLTLCALPSYAAGKLEYNRDIRPIFAENCFACHGPDSAARKASLRLDLREDAIEKKAIVPGKPDESEAITRLFESDPETVMPPPKSHKKMTAAQKATLKQWVLEGANYQPHWSFISPTRPTPPKVKNESWVRNPIDRFILAELDKRGLQPAPEADRWTLARRLSLDLTGLPPDAKLLEEFVNDKSPDAYEKYVDLLLKSPQWGEHRGRYWLDAARFADTHGIHFDNYREMWSYREWVIRAFNDNMKFDQFTTEQLAGDLLPNPTIDQIVATGFNRCNITTNEGGAISEEYLVLYNRDRTETTSTVWMGLTAGCAVCHDHKFDPITMKDFYSMAAFFNNTTQNAMDGNIPNTPPIMPVPKPEDRPRWELIKKQITDNQNLLNERKKVAKTGFDTWLAGVNPETFAGKIPTQGLVFHAPFNEGKGKELEVSLGATKRKITLPEGNDWGPARTSSKTLSIKAGKPIEVAEAGDFDTKQPFTVNSWVRLSKRGSSGAIVSRMDNTNNFRGWDLWVQNDRVGMHIISSWSTDALKVVSKTPLDPNKSYHIAVSYDGSAKAGGVRVFINGEPVPVDIEADQLKSTTKTAVSFKIGQRHTSDRVTGVSIQDLRLYDRILQPQEIQQLGGLARIAELATKPKDKRTAPETEELFSWWLMNEDQAYRELNAKFQQVQAEEVAIRSRGTVAHVMQEKPSEAMAYVLQRGEYDRRKDPVKPLTPKALPAFDDQLPKNRLGFAKWLLRPEHPLTSRVTVNRFWQELYGNGIVRTTGDFGITGELPSHPELLDWLAIEFRENGWDVKKFFKLLVTSSTYRQSAAITKDKLEKDPSNRYLSRAARFRMDAEMIRDYALASSGLLVKKLGGPSVKPYQPDGVWEAVAMIGSNTRDYRRDTGENLYRRSMYTFWKRSAPPASMDVLNAPNRETCAVRRERTNTPLQALVTLNDEQFVEAARVLAEKTIQSGSEINNRLDFLGLRLVSRKWNEKERKILAESLAELVKDFKAKPEEAKKLIVFGESKADPKADAIELAAWTMLANQVMNLDEVLCK